MIEAAFLDETSYQMALKQVAARTEGDMYQHLYFWYEAASLFLPNKRVERVTLEFDDASGVDDIAVFYRAPGIDRGGAPCTADFFQVKYHVDKRKAYSSEAIVDPRFCDSTQSILQRFHSAYLRLASDWPGLRLTLVSNWDWDGNDPLVCSVLADGDLPDRFFDSSPRSKLGKIREKWRKHLGVSGDDFVQFARSLRFFLATFGRRDFHERVYERLSHVGLQVPGEGERACPYLSLAQRFIADRTNSFDKPTLREVCRSEGLLGPSSGVKISSLPTIGIRSFIRCAERLEDETDEYICVAKHFNVRHPRKESSWADAAMEVSYFLNDAGRQHRQREGDHAIALECHNSLAFLAGYELNRSSGCRSYPIQKGAQPSLWRPTEVVSRVNKQQWSISQSDFECDSQDVALAVSISNSVETDVVQFLEEESTLNVGKLIHAVPDTGVGQTNVRGADHAFQLAADLVRVIQEIRPIGQSQVHLFCSAPTSFMFMLGQFRIALGRIVLYEFDFGYERNCTYHRSFGLPKFDGNYTQEV